MVLVETVDAARDGVSHSPWDARPCACCRRCRIRRSRTFCPYRAGLRGGHCTCGAAAAPTDMDRANRAGARYRRGGFELGHTGLQRRLPACEPLVSAARTKHPHQAGTFGHGWSPHPPVDGTRSMGIATSRTVSFGAHSGRTPSPTIGRGVISGPAAVGYITRRIKRLPSHVIAPPRNALSR
jgi:hypothetical protein